MMDHPLFCEGDRVVLVEDHPDGNDDLIIGCTGTVMTTHRDRGDEDALWCGVWWDEEIERGHALEGDVAPYGYGWNVPASALLPEKEIPEEDIQDEDGLWILIGL